MIFISKLTLVFIFFVLFFCGFFSGMIIISFLMINKFDMQAKTLFFYYFQVAVAVKTLKTGSTVEEKLDFLGEADMMKRFDHKNIVKLLGVCTRNEPIYTVMEFMLYGDLKTYLLARYANKTNIKFITWFYEFFAKLSLFIYSYVLTITAFIIVKKTS